MRWMELESVIQSEVSQKEKNKYRMPLFKKALKETLSFQPGWDQHPQVAVLSPFPQRPQAGPGLRPTQRLGLPSVQPPKPSLGRLLPRVHGEEGRPDASPPLGAGAGKATASVGF